mgnify:CR=1 FL=1
MFNLKKNTSNPNPKPNPNLNPNPKPKSITSQLWVYLGMLESKRHEPVYFICHAHRKSAVTAQYVYTLDSIHFLRIKWFQ